MRKAKPSPGREPLFLLTADEMTVEGIAAIVERMTGEKCTPEDLEVFRKELAGIDSGVIPVDD